MSSQDNPVLAMSHRRTNRIALFVLGFLFLAFASVIGGGWYAYVSSGKYSADCAGLHVYYGGFGPIETVRGYSNDDLPLPDLYLAWKGRPPVHVRNITEADVRAFSHTIADVDEIDTIFKTRERILTTNNGSFTFSKGRLTEFELRGGLIDLNVSKTPTGEYFSKLPVDRGKFYGIFGEPHYVERLHGPWA